MHKADVCFQRCCGYCRDWAFRLTRAFCTILSAISWRTFTPFHFVRKAAHFTEFAALGIFSGGFAYNLGKLQNRRCLVLPLTLPLAVAICDELLQNFTGRSCEVADMALDYSGALFGLGIVVICVFIQNKRARRKEHEN